MWNKTHPVAAVHIHYWFAYSWSSYICLLNCCIFIYKQACAQDLILESTCLWSLVAVLCWNCLLFYIIGRDRDICCRM